MENNSFDRLVSGLSSGERKELLDKMKANTTVNESLASEDKLIEDEDIPFELQIKQESIFYRIYLWIKALIANTSMEAIYNERKIGIIAHSIEKRFPDLIDKKRGLLLFSFYDKLNELKLCQDFFRPYITLVENDENAFLVFLGSFVMTEVENRMDEEVDPYSIPLTDGPRPEQRMHLLRKMDEVLSSVPPHERNAMYSAVRSFEWLRQFTKLPVQRFMAMFSTVVEKNYTCSFNAIDSDFTQIAKVMCNGMRIPEEVFESLFLFSRRASAGKSLDSDQEASEKASDFMEKCKSQISMMRMYITTVPMRQIGRVVFAQSSWNPGNFTGGEDWYQKYKTNWRKLFDQKWEAWSADCKKEGLRQSLSKNFDLEKFPLLPERPWSKLWGGQPFKYELTAGFLNWYLKEAFPAHELVLKTVMLEGDFVQKENRQEFNDAFNKLIQLSIDFQSLNRTMACGGEYGIIFTKLMDEKLRSLQASSKVESIIHGLESDVRSMLSSFGDSCRTLESCFSGIFLEKKDSRYDGLSNLSRIGGQGNDKFQAKLKNARESLANCYWMIRELEPIDSPGLVK